MRSSLILCFVLATVVSTYVVDARKEGCQCGGLGPGVNPCTCGEVVVKAAKLPKPVHFASCHAINQAAAQRAAVEAARYSYGSSSSASNDVVQPGSIGSFGLSNDGYNGGYTTGSSSSSTSGSSGISGRYSPYGQFGRGGLGGLLDGSYDLPGVSVVSGSGSCGCKQYPRRPGGPLEVRELLNANTKVVPSFPPIGDLCYPSQTNPKTGEVVRTITKVVPAYPGKVRCCESQPEPCIRPPTPKCYCRREHTCGNHGLEIEPYNENNSEVSESGGYSSSIVNGIGGYGSSSVVNGVGGYGGSSVINGVGGYEGSSIVNGVGGYGGSSLVSGGYGAYGRSSLVSGGYGTYGRSSIVSEDFDDAESFDRDPRSSSSYGSFDDDDDLAPSQQVIPRLPADAVSLTLAYKNLVAPVIVHKQGRKYVPEDRLSFGPRTLPANGQVQKKSANIPEEKLQTVERPVVELKVAPVGPITISDYADNNEEEQLAELEALERERLEQEDQVEQTASSFISYGDLGYAPVGAKLVKVPGQSSVVSSPGGCLGGGYGGPEAACGPLGPPRPDYIPGDVIVHQETIETEEPRDEEEVVEIDHDDDDDDDDDDDVDVPRGFLSRLRLSARKHGGSPCSLS